MTGNKKMRILITNDDGINAPGLDACFEIAKALSDDVWVVAPEYDQSGVSHSLSLNDPLRLRQIDERRFAVKGTPTDCVIMGVRKILNGKAPDLVLSGVNRGRNAAACPSPPLSREPESFRLTKRRGLPLRWSSRDRALAFQSVVARAVLGA